MKSYYASIDHLLLMERLQGTGGAPNFFGQYFRRPTERDGAFWDYEKGIFLGRLTAVLDVGTRLLPARHHADRDR